MKSKKIPALLLAAGMLMSLAGCGVAAEPSADPSAEDALEDTAISLLTSGGHSDTAGKEETVYVVADAAGKPKQIIVENWLKNPDGSDHLADRTELTDVENTKGDEDYTKNADGTITWNANGSDIYYQGRTDKALPVDVSVRYALDGKAVTPEALAGASGHVAITFRYTNNTARQTVIDGKTCTIYQPYVMVSGLLLDNDKASNVTVTNGKTVNDGDRTAVVGMAMPGLNESLGLTDVAEGKIEFPEEVTIEADVTDFSLLTTVTLASGDALGQLGLDDIADLDDMEGKIGELTDGAGKLVDGTAEFSDYMGQLSSAANELNGGAAEVDTYMNALSDGLNTLQSAVTDLPDGAAKLLAGTEALGGTLDLSSAFAALDGIQTGAQTIQYAASELAAGAVSGDTSSPENYGIYEAAAAVKAGADKLNAAAQQVMAGVDTMTNEENLGAIIAGLEELNRQSGTLLDAVDTLRSGAASLREGTGKLSSGMSEADSAVKQLFESSLELKDGMAQLDSDGIQQLAELVRGDLESVFHRLQAVQDYAAEQESFAGSPDGVESSVKFIYKTDTIGK